MLNLTNRCTVIGEAVQTIHPDTGVPTLRTATVLDAQPCAFAVLTAQEAVQAWGDGTAPSTTQSTTAHLLVPNWACPIEAPLDRYTVTVDGYAGNWRVVAARPGADWTTYLLTWPGI
jgi:hypothetical protein